MPAGGRTVTAPGGAEWHVGRQWWPWRMKKREIERSTPVFATVIFPIVAMGLELIAILLVFFWGIGARVVLRRPWTIRARARDGRELTWKAKGFRRSGRVRDAAAEALARGEEHPRPAEALPA